MRSWKNVFQSSGAPCWWLLPFPVDEFAQTRADLLKLRLQVMEICEERLEMVALFCLCSCCCAVGRTAEE